MPRKSTIVVSTKITLDQYEHLQIRIKSLFKSRLIRNCTTSSYIKGLIERDLDYSPKTQYQKLLRLIDSPSPMSSFPLVKSDNPVTIIGDDLISRFNG
jgi:hypothetical protein